MPDLPVVTSEFQPLPPRQAAAHKGTTGRITIIAGSQGMSGAAALAAHGALRGGAGLVRVLTARSAQPMVAGHVACAMVTPLPETEHGTLAEQTPEAWRRLLARQDALAIGPGLGLSTENAVNLLTILGQIEPPLVIDADAITLLAQVHAQVTLHPERHILTPHPGEAARLLEATGADPDIGQDDDSRHAAAHWLACHLKATVLLKGRRTVVCDPYRSYRNTTGNPGMATGGMGDVLTGLIAALLGQGLDAFDAARLAARVHGHAGDLAAREIGPVGLLASDLAERIPAALAEVCGWRR